MCFGYTLAKSSSSYFFPIWNCSLKFASVIFKLNSKTETFHFGLNKLLRLMLSDFVENFQRKDILKD